MKKIFALVLALAMLLCAGCAMADVTDVQYILRGWDTQKHIVTQTEKSAKSCTVVESSGVDVTWNSGWYVVNEDVTISGRITVSGDVHLILADGAKLTAAKNIEVSADNSLTIYGQRADSGKLIAKYTAGAFEGAGIGGGKSNAGGTITIHGGTIEAESYKGAGIGGSSNKAGGIITIYGGTVDAASDNGAGIGGGSASGGTGGTITIRGGTVTAKSQVGAGIGGGAPGYVGSGGNGGTVTITGGKVEAWGMKNVANPASRACAIGGGSENAENHGTLTVSGDQVVMRAGRWNDSGKEDVFPIDDANKYLTEHYAYACIEVTNMPEDEPGGNVSLPQTGDPSMLMGWVCLLGAAGMGLKRRR